MLSIGAMGAGQGDYYLNLAHEDYYLEGGEPPGRWLGQGAEALGLSGTVEKQALRNLFLGVAPDQDRPLIQNAGKDDHQPGWDLTFSAPKSVSTLWAVSDFEIRLAIQEAHDHSVTKALDYLQDEAAFTRRGKGGSEREDAGLVIATFEHGTSRTMDPQLHTHALVLNVASRRDGTFGTIESKPFYEHKMTAGALYRAELAATLERRLGLECERVRSWFEVKGVSKSLTEEFSKRRTEIETFLKEHGLSSASASAYANLATREVKEHASRSKLFPKWQEIGKSHHFTQAEIWSLLKARPARNIEAEKANAVTNALETITAHESHFSAKDLLRASAEAAQGRGLGASELRATVTEALIHSEEIVSLGRVKGEIRYSTREMLEIEKQLLASLEKGRDDDRHTLSVQTVMEKLSHHGELTEEQMKALWHITTQKGCIQVVSGMAGTGKTQMLSVARESWEQEGYRVIGAALAGKAAEGLSEGATIPSETIHRTLLDIERGHLTIDAKTILVIDEAGMVGTRLMAQALEAIREGHGKLVLVGDAKQLQPVDAGGPFKAIGEAVGQVELTEIRRQREQWARDAVHSFAAGHAKEALFAYAERGFLTVADDPREAIRILVADWKKDETVLHQKLILTGTNDEARALNRRIQEERVRHGEIGKASIDVKGDAFHAGDRILFTRNSKLYGVKNGTLGTVEEIDADKQTLHARLDNGDRRTIDLRHYEEIKVGYAVTTHKAQGVTAESVFVVTGGAMQSRELSYVQASRARGVTRIYTDQISAGETLTLLARKMNQSRQKVMAHTVLQELSTVQIKPRQLER